MTPDELRQKAQTIIDTQGVQGFYYSYAWKWMRQKIRQKYHDKCLLCLLEGRDTPADTVHHIQLVQEHPELALDETNLIPVCNAHHFLLHHKDSWLNHEHQVYTEVSPMNDLLPL